MANESQTQAELYISYHEMGDDLSDVWFDFSSEGCRIHQPIDDEEGDKYDIIKDNVDDVTWDKFKALFS